MNTADLVKSARGAVNSGYHNETEAALVELAETITELQHALALANSKLTKENLEWCRNSMERWRRKRAD